jgi:hypothetical protein
MVVAIFFVLSSWIGTVIAKYGPQDRQVAIISRQIIDRKIGGKHNFSRLFSLGK